MSPSDESREPSRPDGRQRRWDRHNAERRLQILEAAVALVEASPPGTEVHVQQIAERAGLVRPVIYRHFSDKADLDRAVQAHVLGMLRAELMPAVKLTGTIEQIISRIVETYVGWAEAHPALHRLAEQERPGPDGPSELQVAIQQIADQVSGLITLGAELFAVRLGEDEESALDLLVFGLVGQAVSAVRVWLQRPVLEPSAEVLSRLMCQSVWYQIDGHARALGMELDPTQPVDDLMLAALGQGFDVDS